MSLADIRTRDLLGVRIALTDYEGAMDAMDRMIERREPGYVCAIAVHALMASRRDPELRAALAGSSLTVPDGRPIVWALGALGSPLPDRVYGPELMARYCARCAERGHRVWLVGGHDETALEELRRALVRRFPGIVIAGSRSPPHRPAAPEEERALAAHIDADAADVVLVGLGAPKQEKWMARMRPQTAAPVLLGVGAAFDFIAGRKRQAPAWMQRAGLEWAFRLAQEPLRLGPRYLRHNPAFVAAFARQWAHQRRARRSRPGDDAEDRIDHAR